MNRLRLLLAFVILTAAPGFAQTRTTTEQDDHDELNDRLGSMIDRFITDVTHQFRHGGRTVEDVDSLPAFAQGKQEGRATISFDGDKTIDESETIKADVVLKGGDLKVYGTVDGDVLVVGGTLYVKAGGRITGNARAINGDIIKDDDGWIGGYIDKRNTSTAGYRPDRGRFTRFGHRLDAEWVDELTNIDNFIYRFNRVEGHFFGLGSEKKYYWDGSRRYTAYGSVGWGAKSHRWRYNLGLVRQFALPNNNPSGGEILEVGAEGHSLTDTKDDWIIGMNENTAAALLLHEDYRDYFGRDGFGVHVGYYTQQDYVVGQFQVEYLLDQYRSLDNRTEWSIFGGRKVFRPNPAIDEGRMHSIVVSPGFSTITETRHGQEGWSLFGTAEFARQSFGGDFDFTQLMADLRRYQPLSRYDNLNVRVRVGTSTGRLPLQKVFEFGGLGTLDARPYKSDAGNRMILMNAEYIFNGDILHDLDFWPSWLLRHINFIVLSDAGLMRITSFDADWTRGFDKIRWAEFKHDIGFGISNQNGSFRLGFVWRTDVRSPGRLFFRFNRPF
jgi:hypothetical protein